LHAALEGLKTHHWVSLTRHAVGRSASAAKRHQ
jgi:hypothetical protein